QGKQESHRAWTTAPRATTLALPRMASMASGKAVVLFTYNRPRHTAEVLRALARNQPERLIVFQDGLRPGHDPAAHAEVARLLETVDFGRPEIVRRPTN